MSRLLHSLLGPDQLPFTSHSNVHEPLRHKPHFALPSVHRGFDVFPLQASSLPLSRLAIRGLARSSLLSSWASKAPSSPGITPGRLTSACKPRTWAHSPRRRQSGRWVAHRGVPDMTSPNPLDFLTSSLLTEPHEACTPLAACLFPPSTIHQAALLPRGPTAARLGARSAFPRADGGAPMRGSYAAAILAMPPHVSEQFLLALGL
ncbi:hypothetical protein NDU88_004614 [Pleurodeles waltl]|uniref:Uncharacterized protein n=1 Tax=Pleurodeles waltl TaxID=8319 RepID=A0AAV7SJD4_PLEWA|nr:hypothetical protein NDU88_004614 [Pleurodeles waltl]